MLIYKVTNKIDGKMYIGQTIGDLNMRRIQHIGNARVGKDNMYFHKAIRKYGEDNFRWEVVHDYITTMEFLNRLEIFYIGYYDTFENGYNLTLGGGGMMGYKHSAENRKKISDANRDGARSAEHRKKLSEANKGKTFSAEHKKKISEAMKGITRSIETRKKMSNAKRGYKHSAKARKKISEATKDGNKGGNNPSARPIMIGDICFCSLITAAEKLSVTPLTIGNRIKHKTKWPDYKYVI